MIVFLNLYKHKSLWAKVNVNYLIGKSQFLTEFSFWTNSQKQRQSTERRSGPLETVWRQEYTSIMLYPEGYNTITALFQSNYTGEKGIPRPFKKSLDIEPELTLIVEHMKCHNDLSIIILSIIGSKNIWIYSWYFPSSWGYSQNRHILQLSEHLCYFSDLWSNHHHSGKDWMKALILSPVANIVNQNLCHILFGISILLLKESKDAEMLLLQLSSFRKPV